MMKFTEKRLGHGIAASSCLLGLFAIDGSFKGNWKSLDQCSRIAESNNLNSSAHVYNLNSSLSTSNSFEDDSWHSCRTPSNN